jgi:2-polyprenyl-6-methoxyphenol hydroxylase-like FAD-dependent oxidoreductase
MREVDATVVIVGAAPTGLMLAGELGLAGVRPLVLERLTEVNPVAKAGGIGGRILELMDYRPLGERIRAAGSPPPSGPGFPFGGIHVDMSILDESPMHALLIPQPELERLLEEYAVGLGAEVRRGHALIGLRQDDGGVTLDVRGPNGPYTVTARYVVGCDGVGSRVRELAGIPYLGVDYPEVQRIGRTTLPDGVTVRDDGGYDVAGYGVLPFGYTQTAGGVIAAGAVDRTTFGVYTAEDEDTEYDDAEPMTRDELSASITRVLGVELPLGDPIRLTRFTYAARNAQRYRDGRVFLAGDAAHRFPSGGVALNAGMVDVINLAWKLAAVLTGGSPDALLDTYHDERHPVAARTLQHTQAQVALRRGHDEASEALRKVFAELMSDEQATRRIGAMIAGSDIGYDGTGHPLVGEFLPNLPLYTERYATSVGELLKAVRPVLLDLADRADARTVAAGFGSRVDVVQAAADDPPAEALLIRPDGHIAWAATNDDRVAGLRDALESWFGEMREADLSNA